MMTLEQANEITSGYSDLIELAIPIANRLAKVKGYDHEFDRFELSYNGGGEIDAEWSEYIGCGDYDGHEMEIPLEYLFDDDFIKKAEEEQKLADERAKEAYNQREKDRKNAADNREKEQYLKLKEKWG